MRAQVAQLVEHVTENHGVGGSIPPLGTTISRKLTLLLPREMPHLAFAFDWAHMGAINPAEFLAGRTPFVMGKNPE